MLRHDPYDPLYGTVFYGRRSILSEGTIWAINLDGGGDRYVTAGARPRVSSDGRYLAFLREGNPFENLGNLWIRDLITGEERRIFTNTTGMVGYDWQYGRTNLFFDFACDFWQIFDRGVRIARWGGRLDNGGRPRHRVRFKS